MCTGEGLSSMYRACCTCSFASVLIIHPFISLFVVPWHQSCEEEEEEEDHKLWPVNKSDRSLCSLENFHVCIYVKSCPRGSDHTGGQ